jgi:L-Ala-D/L-Glu epimerase
MWSVNASVVELPLAERFTIARESWDSARNVFVTVERDGTTGVGEVSPAESAGESPDAIVAELQSVGLDALAGPFDLESVTALLPAGSARAALDIALHDLAAQLAGCSVAELLGVGGRRLPPTSVTVPISDVAAMVRRAEALTDHPVIKIKVGFGGDVAAVAAVRDVYDGRIRIDANEGWDEPTATARLAELEAFDIELCEQPVPAGNPGALARLTRGTSIPVFADEDVRTAADVARLAEAVDGVNLKLRKAGGIRETVRAIATARAHGLDVMLGCDLESGLAATAQASVAALVDHADLDGPLLLASDPWPGVRYERGRMTLPPGPGLGVQPAAR